MYRAVLVILIVAVSLSISSAQSKIIYLGKVGYEKTRLILNSKKEGKVTGKFRLEEKKLKFTVDGNIENRNIQLSVFDESKKKVALLIGKISGFEIEGSFTNVDGSKTDKFKFIEMVVPEIGELKLQESFSGGDLKISLPKLINHSIPATARDFNREIKEIYSSKYRTWSLEMRENGLGEKTSYDLDFKIIEKGPMLISVLVSEFVYTEGAAHGNTSFKVLNYSIKESKLISDYEMMKLINDFGGSLVVRINEELTKMGGCTVENIKDIPIPNITEDALVFTFDSYALGGYVCGNPSVRILFTSLK